MTTISVTLDAWRKNNLNISANQGEVNSRFLEITLTENGTTLNLTDKSVIFYTTKPDGNIIFNSCKIENAQKGLVSVCLTSQMSAVSGLMPCEIHIIDTEKSTLKFIGLTLKIIPCADSDSAVESTSEFTMLQEAIAKCINIGDQMLEHMDLRNNPHEVTAEQAGAVPITRTINSKPLNSNIELTCTDIGAASTEIHTVTIPLSWLGSSAPYTQTISVNGITSADTPIVDVILSSSTSTALSQLEAWGCVSKIITGTNQITVTCLENKPNISIPIQLKVVR